MNSIRIIRQADEAELSRLGVRNWPTWSKEASTFPWHYASGETCYFLAGDVIVTPDGGEPVGMGKGDIAIFPVGMSCTWDIRQPVKKHYRFG